MENDGRVEVDIEIDDEVKETLVDFLFRNPDKSLNQIIEEALRHMLHEMEKNPDLLEKYKNGFKPGP